MTLLRSIAVVAALAALTTGCSSNDLTVTPTPVAPTTSTPDTTPSATTPTPSPEAEEFPEPVPPVPVSDGTSEKVFGDDLFADNTVADLAAKWIDLTLAEGAVVTGEISPLKAVRRLPLREPAKTAALRTPTSWTLVSATDPANGGVGIGAEHLNREAMNVTYSAVRRDGIDQLNVNFIAQVRVTYEESGQTYTIDGQRAYELWLVQTTDTRDDKWAIKRYNVERMDDDNWNEPVPVAGE